MCISILSSAAAIGKLTKHRKFFPSFSRKARLGHFRKPMRLVEGERYEPASKCLTRVLATGPPCGSNAGPRVVIYHIIGSGVVALLLNWLEKKEV